MIEPQIPKNNPKKNPKRKECHILHPKKLNELGLLLQTQQKQRDRQPRMAGLRINGKKNAIAVSMIVITAFKTCICISHRKSGFFLSQFSEILLRAIGDV
jgi:hypothetical protein